MFPRKPPLLLSAALVLALLVGVALLLRSSPPAPSSHAPADQPTPGATATPSPASRDSAVTPPTGTGTAPPSEAAVTVTDGGRIVRDHRGTDGPRPEPARVATTTLAQVKGALIAPVKTCGADSIARDASRQGRVQVQYKAVIVGGKLTLTDVKATPFGFEDPIFSACVEGAYTSYSATAPAGQVDGEQTVISTIHIP